MFRKLFALLAVSATASAGFVAAHMAATSGAAPSASAADAASFNPGNLISDENFYDGLAMSAEEVQAFLESQNSSGEPTALRNYTQRTPSLPADAHCAAYEGVEGESAASIIARVGEVCNLSPKAMLVLLEKEQSLVSMSAPSEGQLAAATGFNCPDTAPCDSSVAGFFYQIYYGARQFQVYRAEPYSFNHVPNASNNILYNPNFQCGSAPVYIENSATAGLYNYTPYQPNQAALANLYGEGDGCSAYGNRNFWRMYADWFGDPHAVNESGSSLVQTEEDGEVFLDVNGTRHRVPTEYLGAYEALGRVRKVPAETLAAMPQGADAGSIVKGAHGWIYLLAADGKRWTFPDCETVATFGGSCEKAVQITDEQFSKYSFAGTVQPLVRTPDGMSLYVEGGVKREVTGLGLLKVRGYDVAGRVMQLDASALQHLPYGEPMWGVGAVVVSESSAAPVLLDGAGTGYEVPESMREFPWLAPTTISDASYAKITVSGSLAPAMTDGANFFIASERGMMRVNRAQYGTAIQYSAIPASFARNVRVVDGVDGPHLVQEIGSEEVSIVSGGQRASFPNAAGAEGEARKRGVDTHIHRVPAGVLEHITVGNGVGNGALLMAENSDELYLLDGAHLQRVASAELAGELGFATTPMRITQASFDRIPQRKDVLDGVQLRCGEQDWLAIGGKRYAFANQQVQAAYGLESQSLSSTLCALIPMAQEPLGDLLQGPDGTVYWIDGGKHRAVSTPELLAQMGGEKRVMPKASDAALAQIPAGEPLSAVPAGYAPPTSTQAPAQTQAPVPSESPAAPQPTAAPSQASEQVEQTQAGEVLTNPAGSGVWLRAGDGLVQIGSQSVADALGLDVRAPRAVTQATIDSFKGTTRPLYVPAVRCGGVNYLGLGGELVPYASPEAERAFGLEHVELAPESCTGLRVSIDRTIGQDAKLPDGTPVRVEDGKLRPVVEAAPTQEPAMTAPPAQSPDPAGTEPVSTGADPTPAGTAPAPGASAPAGTQPTPGTSAPDEPVPSASAPSASAPGEPAPGETPELLTLPIELVSAMDRGEPVTG